MYNGIFQFNQLLLFPQTPRPQKNVEDNKLIDETEVNNKEMFLRYPFSHLQ